MEFEVTGFLSDIRARVDDMLAELDAWPVMYERLIEYKEREGRWRRQPKGSWETGATPSGLPGRKGRCRKIISRSWTGSVSNGKYRTVVGCSIMKN